MRHGELFIFHVLVSNSIFSPIYSEMTCSSTVAVVADTTVTVTDNPAVYNSVAVYKCIEGMKVTSTTSDTFSISCALAADFLSVEWETPTDSCECE